MKLEGPGLVSKDRAKEIASWWHGGQWSPLYAFCSSGSITPGIKDEVYENIDYTEKHGDQEPDDLKHLYELLEYLRVEEM